jgi:hypothetical protein
MYDPKELLKFYLYGYMNRIRSSRRLETESGRNLELIWLLRTLCRDHKTIAEFRRRNGEALKNVFKGFVVRWGRCYIRHFIRMGRGREYLATRRRARDARAGVRRKAVDGGMGHRWPNRRLAGPIIDLFNN